MEDFICNHLCFTILFVFVYSISIVFMLLRYLTITLSLSYSHTKVLPIHFIYHSTSSSCRLPQPIPFILLIIVHYFHIYHIWSYSCYIAIQSYFHVKLRNAILLKYTNSWADIKTYASKPYLASIKLSIQSK